MTNFRLLRLRVIPLEAVFYSVLRSLEWVLRALEWVLRAYDFEYTICHFQSKTPLNTTTISQLKY